MRLSHERLAEIVGELSVKPGHDKVKAGIHRPPDVSVEL
jgi:hypothetical protein